MTGRAGDATDGSNRSPIAADAPAVASARARWRALVHDALPAAAARGRDWPIALDHCFARVILDTVCGRPWRDVLAAPAWRSMDAPMLADAIALAEAILDGSADLRALDARSRRWRAVARAQRSGSRVDAVPPGSVR